MGDSVLQVRHLSKSFGSHEVLKDIDFTVDTGEVICIIGPSGGGKSTFLRRNGVEAHPVSFQGRHGVPVLQPVQQSQRDGKLRAGADAGIENQAG